MVETGWNWLQWVERSSAHRRVLEFLNLDIQNSPEWGRELLAKVEALETGEVSEWTRSGNAYCLSLSPHTATIENLLNDEETIETIALWEFKEAVSAWQHQLERSP